MDPNYKPIQSLGKWNSMKIKVPEMLIYKTKAGYDKIGLTLTKTGNLASISGMKSIQLIPEKTKKFELSPGYNQAGLVYLN
jgi:hypothetical protein